MSSESPCAHRGSPSLLAKPTIEKMIIWDWYDGPETGLFICDECRTEFYFFMVDWSDDQNIRVFALQQLQSGSIATLVGLVNEEPKWPIWMPVKLKFPCESDREWIDRLDSLVLSGRQVPSMVLAWDNVNHSSMRIMDITNMNAPYVQRLLESDSMKSQYDWFEFLGIHGRQS